MFDDLINRTDKSIKELDNKINQQPYILYNKVKMYFKKPSSDLEVIQLNDTEFDLKYYYHNIKSNVQVIDKYDGDIHEKLDHLLNDIDNYINKVEKNQIIKTINFSFNIDTSSNFNDEYLVDKMIDNYIINNINNRYRNYEIISKTRESNNNSKLYSIELNYNNRTIIEYYLIFNVFCINLTQNDYINSSMRNIIAKMMLSLNLCLDYQNPFLNFTNDNLKQAFEIKEKTEDININKYSVETNENKVSEQINNQLNKFINLLKNYNKANEDINFNTNQIFNFLLLGNNSREKEETLNHIQNLFIEYKIFGENIDIFEFDVKKEYLSNKNIVSILNKNIKSNNIIYINNFDYISKTNEEIENNFVLSLNDLVHNDKIKCIIISGKKEETLKILNHVNNLIESFSYKIILEDYSIDKIYDILINKIENSNYKIAFEEANAKEIIKKLYKQSEEKNDSFINKLYTKMFQNVLENDLTEFNTNCFPTISDENNINISINELNNLIGLENVKKEVKN